MRIIPADAGNTPPNQSTSLLGWDHPRGCGEHPPDFVQKSRSRGSSPRMRGTHCLLGVHDVQVGIIPADAGNTSTQCPPCHGSPDHPRGCGEHFLPGSVGRRPWGSSPRMRGTRSLTTRPTTENRIIPADAGNTGRPVFSPRHPQDHPRGCGEHFRRRRSSALSRGSSPRMRGTLGVQARRIREPGIIPADAGNTSSSLFLPSLVWDHPRGCGEHTTEDQS